MLLLIVHGTNALCTVDNTTKCGCDRSPLSNEEKQICSVCAMEPFASQSSICERIIRWKAHVADETLLAPLCSSWAVVPIGEPYLRCFLGFFRVKELGFSSFVPYSLDIERSLSALTLLEILYHCSIVFLLISLEMHPC